MSAVLLIVFNRPDVTQRVFESIRKAKPGKLYVFADAPRADRPADTALNAQVKQIVSAIDWECEFKTFFCEKNLGCRFGPLAAIDWFFEHEEEGVILEDDCLADESFYPFCNELLEKYRHNDNVMVISGNYFHGNHISVETSYFFSNYMHSWGWASWRRAWKKNDRFLEQWPALRETDLLEKTGNGHKDFVKYWTGVFDRAIIENGGDYWDYQWLFSCWATNGISIIPAHNLVKNIGFGNDATHTVFIDKWVLELPLEKMSFPLKHPASSDVNREADRWDDLNVFRTKISLFTRVKNKIRRTILHKTGR